MCNIIHEGSQLFQRTYSWHRPVRFYISLLGSAHQHARKVQQKDSGMGGGGMQELIHEDAGLFDHAHTGGGRGEELA